MTGHCRRGCSCDTVTVGVTFMSHMFYHTSSLFMSLEKQQQMAQMLRSVHPRGGPDTVSGSFLVLPWLSPSNCSDARSGPAKGWESQLCPPWQGGYLMQHFRFPLGRPVPECLDVCSSFTFPSFFRCINLKGRAQEKVFHPLAHSPDGCSCQGWPRQKPEFHLGPPHAWQGPILRSV